MAAFFVYAAVMQTNDPDPGPWIVMYLVAAGLSAAGAFKLVPPALTFPVVAVAVIWAATLIPASLDAGFSVDAEEPRELFGLLIVAVWLAVIGASRSGQR